MQEGHGEAGPAGWSLRMRPSPAVERVAGLPAFKFANVKKNVTTQVEKARRLAQSRKVAKKSNSWFWFKSKPY
jgi:hypothetical protein